MEKYRQRLKNFHQTVEGCIKQVWQELSPEQKEAADDILIQAWIEEDQQGFHYSEKQILANFLSQQILYPCYDAVFKAIFLNDEDYTLLKDLISWAVFEGQRKIIELELISSEPIVGLNDEKIFHCDIVVMLDTEQQCNIEMQLANHMGLASRIILQTAKLHAAQAKRGIKFIQRKSTLALWIMPFDFTKLEYCHNSARLRFDQSPDKILSDDLQFHFFEFTKKVAPKQDGLGLWKNFFGMQTIEDYNNLKQQGDIMAQAANNLASLSNNPAFRKNVVEESFKELGRRIELGAHYEQGFKEGTQQGEVKGKIEAIEAILEIKFGARGLHCIKQIQAIQDLDQLNKIFLMAKQSSDIDIFENELNL